MDIIELAVDLIDEDADQPRYQFGEQSLQELMKSIDEIGLLSPIKVRTVAGGRYKIIYGNRRYKASKMLGRATIPCIVSSATDEVDIYLEQIAENLTREGFSPIEEAEAFDKPLNNPRFSGSVKFLSSKLSKPESYIRNKIDLLKFGPAIKRMIVGGTEIRKGQLTEEQLLPLKDLLPEHRDPLAQMVARDELPVSDVKKIAQLFKDKDISSGMKDKLLYKNGPQLLETWSVFRHNKAEREKAARLKAEQEQLRLEEEQMAAEQADAQIVGEQADAQAGELSSAPEAAVGEPGAAGQDIREGAPDRLREAADEGRPGVDLAHDAASSPLEQWLAQLQAALPAGLSFPEPLPDADAYAQLSAPEQARLQERMNAISALLEARLAEWNAFKQTINRLNEPLHKT